MNVNSIQNSYQNKQNFGMALRKPKPQVGEYLSKVFQDDVKIAKKYSDTFTKVQKKQADNSLYDIELVTGKEHDSEDTSAKFIANVTKKGSKEPTRSFVASRGVNINIKTRKVQDGLEKKDIVSTLQEASDYATNQAEVDKIISRTHEK